VESSQRGKAFSGLNFGESQNLKCCCILDAHSEHHAGDGDLPVAVFVFFLRMTLNNTLPRPCRFYDSR
jgi:hypothetical protein